MLILSIFVRLVLLNVRHVKFLQKDVYLLMAVILAIIFIMIQIAALPNALMATMLTSSPVSVKTVLLGVKLVMGLPMINVILVDPIRPTLPKLTIRRLC